MNDETNGITFKRKSIDFRRGRLISGYLTLDEAAKKLRISVNTLSRYERGVSPAPFSAVLDMEKVYGIPIEAFKEPD